MVYVVVQQQPIYRQMTLEQFLFTNFSGYSVINPSGSCTKTMMLDRAPESSVRGINVPNLIRLLTEFNSKHENLSQQDRKTLYFSFHIPKKSGGLRKIDAPKIELMECLRELKDIFENDFKALYHTSAFAYVKKRCAVDAVRRHQGNHSKWFGKFDLSNFFGSTTVEFLMSALSKIFPFNEVISDPIGKQELQKALDMAFLDGGLPQGTPISPMLTNLMMIPIDFELTKTLRDYNGKYYIYTRYADDFIISSRSDFSIGDVQNLIVETLQKHQAPFQLNRQKTRYGSSNGANWNLGVMLNKDNEITVGHKRKKQFKMTLFSYVADKKSNINWSLDDVQVMHGLYRYYRSVERDTIDSLIQAENAKHGVDLVAMMIQDMKALS